MHPIPHVHVVGVELRLRSQARLPLRRGHDAVPATMAVDHMDIIGDNGTMAATVTPMPLAAMAPAPPSPDAGSAVAAGKGRCNPLPGHPHPHRSQGHTHAPRCAGGAGGGAGGGDQVRGRHAGGREGSDGSRDSVPRIMGGCCCRHVPLPAQTLPVPCGCPDRAPRLATRCGQRGERLRCAVAWLLCADGRPPQLGHQLRWAQERVGGVSA